jgi:hypothetical protein
VPPRAGSGGGAGGESGGEEVARLVANIVADASGIVAAYQEAEEAGAAAAQQTQQYLGAIQRAFEEAGERGDFVTQAFLQVGQSVLQSGRSFTEAAQAMRSVGDGARFAQDIVRQLRDDVTRLGQSEESAMRTTADFYRQLERRPNIQQQPQYREVRTGEDQTRFQRIAPGERPQFVSAAEAQQAQQEQLQAPENQARLYAARAQQQRVFDRVQQQAERDQQEQMRQQQQVAQREALRRAAPDRVEQPGQQPGDLTAVVDDRLRRERQEDEQRQAQASRDLADATRQRAQEERQRSEEESRAVAETIQQAREASERRRETQEREAAPRQEAEAPERPERRERPERPERREPERRPEEAPQPERPRAAAPTPPTPPTPPPAPPPPRPPSPPPAPPAAAPPSPPARPPAPPVQPPPPPAPAPQPAQPAERREPPERAAQPAGFDERRALQQEAERVVAALRELPDRIERAVRAEQARAAPPAAPPQPPRPERVPQPERPAPPPEPERQRPAAQPAAPAELPPGMPPFIPFAPGQERQRFLADQRQQEQQQAEEDRRRRQQAADQQAEAERNARVRGAVFQRVETGQVVRPFPGRVQEGGTGEEEAAGGGGGGGFLGGLGGATNLIRFGAGLAGIPLGLNIVAGAARDLHDWLERSAAEAEAINRSAQQLGVLFGASATQARQFANSLSAAQNFRLSSVQEAIAQTEELGRSYQFSTEQAQSLVQATTQLARINNQPNQALPGLQQRVSQAVQGGGQVPELNVDLTNQFLNRRLQIPVEQLTPEAAAQVRAGQVQVQLQEQLERQRQAGQQPGQGDPNYEAEQRRNAAFERFSRPFGDLFNNLGRQVNEVLGNAAGGQTPQEAARDQARRRVFQEQGVEERTFAATGPGATPTLQLVRQGEQAPLPTVEQDRIRAEADRAAADATSRVTDEENRLTEARRQEAEQAAASTTVLQRAQSEISRTLQDISTTTLQPGQQAAQLGAIARGPLPAAAPPEGNEAFAQGQAAQAVAQERAAQEARRAQQREGPAQPSTAVLDTLRQELEAARQAEGVDSQRYADALQLLQVHDRDLAYYRGTAELERANMAIEIAQGEAQSQANQVNFRERQQQLAAADDIADARIRVLQTEREIAPLQLQQERLQNAISVASRTNLADEQNLLRVRQQGLGISSQQEEITHQLNAAQAEASASMARVLQGGQADPGQFRQLFQQARQATLQQAELGPAVEQQRHAEAVAQQPITQEQLQREQVLNVLEGQRRALEDASFIQQDKQRVAQNEADELQRQLDIERLQDEPLRTAAGLAQLNADEWKNAADDSERQLLAMRNMIDYWNPLVTAADAYRTSLAQIPQNLGGTGEVQVNAAGGVGNQPYGPSPTTPQPPGGATPPAGTTGAPPATPLGPGGAGGAPGPLDTGAGMTPADEARAAAYEESRRQPAPTQEGINPAGGVGDQPYGPTLRNLPSAPGTGLDQFGQPYPSLLGGAPGPLGRGAAGGITAQGVQTQPSVPVVNIPLPGQLGGISVAVNLQGATINNQDDIERISNQAASAAYSGTRERLIAALNGAQPTVSPSLAGSGGGR